MDSLTTLTTEELAASIIYWRTFKGELSAFDSTQRDVADEHLEPLYDELDRREAEREEGACLIHGNLGGGNYCPRC